MGGVIFLTTLSLFHFFRNGIIWLFVLTVTVVLEKKVMLAAYFKLLM